MTFDVPVLMYVLPVVFHRAGTSEKGVQSHGEEEQSEGEALGDQDQETSHIHQQVRETHK